LDNPYYDLLIVGGEDHPTGSSDDAKKRYSSLEAWTRKRFRMEGIEYRGSGQVLEPKDSLAFIGRNPRDKKGNTFIATGDSGNGMTHGAIAGMILSDLVPGKHSPWAALYNPSRRIKSRPKRSVGGTRSGRTKKSQNDLHPGEGAVIEKKAPIAAYRDVTGKLHQYSAVCPHLGCALKWNGSEKSFDCPCHGSRFSYSGLAINGPANDDLQKPSKK
jgi:Rieske Fe-S protein